MTPLQQYDAALAEVRQADRLVRRATGLSNMTPVSLRYLDSARNAIAHADRLMRKARTRLVLSAIAYGVTAAIIVGVLYALIVLLWAAFGAEPTPDITNVQLPTL